MARKKKKNTQKAKKKPNITFALPRETKKMIGGVITFALAFIVLLSFWHKAGIFGEKFLSFFSFLIGNTIYTLPLFLFLSGAVFLNTEYRKFLPPTILAILIIILGISGILAVLEPELREGGTLGYILSKPLLKLFGFLVTQIIFCTLVIIGILIFWQLLTPQLIKKKEQFPEEKKEGVFTRVLGKVRETPKFKVKEIAPLPTEKTLEQKEEKASLELEVKKVPQKPLISKYKIPPLDLLEEDKERPTAGDTRAMAMIIKKTLENFDIPVEMAEINIGPTVTQYTLKPAEGIKLSKITTLSNNLALALAAHPIRIEAPIPGRSLVGIEVPNTVRARIRLRNLLSDPIFQNSSFTLPFALGKDVSGEAIYGDLSKMPHLLVAGATGTGKTTAADTFMFTERGMLTFEELYPLPLNSEADFEIKVVSRDGVEKTKKIYNNGICQFYKLSTARGYQIEATAEHPLWVMNEDGWQSWKQASLIKKGDYVAISRGPALFGNKINISDFKPSKIKAYHKKISFPSEMTPQLGQFLGLLTADGGLSVEKKGIHRVIYTQANHHLIWLYKKLLRELFGISQFIEKISGSNPKNKARDIIVNSKHLKEFLAYLGMGSVKSPQKEIPRAIREAPKEIVTTYLRALFDNDGYVEKDSIELCMSSKKLTSQIHIMLLNFGIVSSLSIKKVKNYADNEYYKLSIYGQEARKFIKEIGFIRKEKYEKAKAFLKLSPNSNVNVIPHLSFLLKTLAHKYLNSFALLTNRGWQYQSGILIPKYAFNSLRSYNSGARMPSYRALERILDFYQPISSEKEYEELDEISKRNFFWDKVEKIKRTSGVGYDFFVPGSDSFVGNGFVNHNTIFLNSLMLSLLYQKGPEMLRLVLVDPKRVEFTAYNKLPHLLGPVIHDAQTTVQSLNWLTSEMSKRFDILAEEKVRDIVSYNEKVLKEGNGLMPYIVFIVDELADLIMAKGREIEAGIVRLAQLARAVGIHLVLATQRPSVEVITGLIKANITSRVSFQVASQIDSRTVLDMAGAERLLGLGDLLFLSATTVKPKRIQGAFVSEKEVKKVVKWIEEQNVGILAENGLGQDLKDYLEKGGEEGIEEISEYQKEGFFAQDPLYPEAKRIVIERGRASASFLQRKLRIGYARAARLLDILEERGVVGPANGAKPRKVFLKEEDFGKDYNENI